MNARRDAQPVRNAATIALGLTLALSGCTGESLLDLPSSATASPRFATLGERVDATQAVEWTGQTLSLGDSPVQLNVELDGGRAAHRVEFGSARAGDEWTVELVRNGGGCVVALFDQDMHLLALSVHAAREPLHHVFATNAERVFVGITSAEWSGPITVTLEASRVAGTPIPPLPQFVRLNFGGGDAIRIANRAAMTFGEFDAGELRTELEGQTDALRDAIRATIVANFSGLDVRILEDGETLEKGVPCSTLHFGGSDAALLGLADRVDGENADPDDEAVIFTDNFGAYADAMALDVDELGVMIGNVASHELGHLLGLVHTAHPASVMDAVSGDAWDLIEPRNFEPAPLDPKVFPAGSQDAMATLLATVGASDESTVKAAPAAARIRQGGEADVLPMAHSVCGHAHAEP